MFLSEAQFGQVVATTPLVSVDFVVKERGGKYLFGERVNRPARTYWFVPGGRILKNESIDSAFSRLSIQELGLACTARDSEFMGVFEHFYSDSAISDAISTHYVVLAYQISVNLSDLELPTIQHETYHWLSVEEILASDKVHEHSKWYFQ